MEIGLFFGSFNPVHVGHLVIARTIINTTGLEQVWFVVSPQNPLKERKTLAHEFDRYDMVRQATHEASDLWASDLEFSLPRPSYTIDTLTYLSEKYPEHKFSLIMGSDNLMHIKKWKNWELILKFYRLIIYPRPGFAVDLSDYEGQIELVKNCPSMEISASMIREFVSQRQSIKYLVPKEAEEFIEAKGLYSS